MNVEDSQASLKSSKTDNAVARQVAYTIPPGLASYLLEEPNTLREDQASFEWPQWPGEFEQEMDGKISRGVWKRRDRAKGKMVLETRLVLKY